MTRLLKILMIVAAVVAAFIAALMMHGCAHVSAVADACKPTTAQEMAIVEAASHPVQAEALAAIDALGFALCVLQQGADDAIGALQSNAGETTLALTAEAYSPVVANLKAWRKAHP
jgi:hypothetical protein